MKTKTCFYFVAETPLNDRNLKPLLEAVLGKKLEWATIHPDQWVFFTEDVSRQPLQTFLDTYQQEQKGKFHLLKTYRLHPLGEQASRLGLKKNPGKVDLIGDFLLQRVLEGQVSLLPTIRDEFASVPRHLMQTAAMLMDSNMNASIASDRLYVHRNTFNYRLNQFVNLTGLDIRQHDHALLFTLVEKLLMR